MKVHLGAGWFITHITDRTVRLEKPDVAYRKFTGADGFVFTRGEPGVDRKQLIADAESMARKNDDLLADMIGNQMIPSKMQLKKYAGEVLSVEPAFRTKEDPGLIGVKRP